MKCWKVEGWNVQIAVFGFALNVRLHIMLCGEMASFGC